ncbi:MAG: hypothetical protein FD153_1523 [Rhodospirillaceae bacterium]|nr:MAG: hypothetical protein FD153_1523 [Rhodospirillaceae bacterium]
MPVTEVGILGEINHTLDIVLRILIIAATMQTVDGVVRLVRWWKGRRH